MSQVRKMTGTSWQIEKHYETNAYTRNCVNCTYFQEEGRMCRKHNEHISFSFAKNCKYFENENGPIPEDHINQKIEYYESPILKEEPISCMFLIRTKKRWNKNYIKNKTSILINCSRINDKRVLEEMKKANFIIIYDGFSTYKVKARFISITNGCLVFYNKGVYNFYIPGFIRLSNSKTKIIVNDRYYNSVLFVKERVGG